MRGFAGRITPSHARSATCRMGNYRVSSFQLTRSARLFLAHPREGRRGYVPRATPSAAAGGRESGKGKQARCHVVNSPPSCFCIRLRLDRLRKNPNHKLLNVLGRSPRRPAGLKAPPFPCAPPEHFSAASSAAPGSLDICGRSRLVFFPLMLHRLCSLAPLLSA